MLLLVEDDDSLREVLTFNLEDAGFEVEAVADGEAGLAAFDPSTHDVVLTDLRMPGIDGMELLSELKERDPEAVVLVVTAYGNTERAVEAMRRGAFHYVEKPVNKLTLQAIVEKAVDHRRIRRKNRELEQAAGGPGERDAIVAASPAMNEVMRLVDRVARSAATVLIRGESGTGKELIARAIHDRSDRADHPFVTVNCAAIPQELLESVLFGHTKGAFTGATEASEGKFAAADGGTILLDEIAEMSPQLQSKLLRVLQEREIDIVGASEPKSIDVRVLAATHRDIDALVEEGAFREDLYFRLNVVPLEIPPLRERPEDIPVLVRHFLRQNEEFGDREVDRQVDEAFVDYDWPGNVRELRNVVERMCLLRKGERLTLEDVPDEIRRGGEEGGAGPQTDPLPFELPDEGLDLMELEKAVIRSALEKHDGNQSATARYLNLPRHKLLYRIEKFGLDK
jgi:two-component system NtrC family response regulator